MFEELSPDVEPISLDEAFIDVSTTLRALKGTSREIGERLKHRVYDATGLKVSRPALSVWVITGSEQCPSSHARMLGVVAEHAAT